MIYKSWMVLNILDKFYYHASKQHSYCLLYTSDAADD